MATIIFWLILLSGIWLFYRKKKKRRKTTGMQIPQNSDRAAIAKERERFYRENQDVLVGMGMCATLQFRTCLVCGVLDGMQYTFEQHPPRLPLHPGCRCILLPVTPLSDFMASPRPAEMVPVAYFAELRYNAKKRKKQFAELAKSTQKKYYYAEEKILTSQGVKVWRQFEGNYTKWFNSLPAKYQKIIVGDERFALMKKNHLQIADLVDIANLREYTIEELKQKYEF